MMMSSSQNKTIGQVIDEIISAVESLDVSDRPIVMRAVSDRLKTSGLSVSNDEMTTQPANLRSRSLVDHSEIMDIRKLKEQKDPKTAIEMACVVGYHLEAQALPAERKQEITSSDLEKYLSKRDIHYRSVKNRFSLIPEPQDILIRLVEVSTG